ncbi:MAG: alcohol dehydrogenase catalytic domain-containing protein [Hyphomonadaceae bacterium]|nr:alcohol dehydrogenase catalytic domain-containing protein [Hyphomonadaceae bacterium]
MRAAVFDKVGSPLSIEAVAEPACGPNELILAVRQCGICGTDLHASQGGLMEPPPGTIFGHEFSGEVVDIGSDLKADWQIGDAAVSLPMIGCGTCNYCLSGNPFFCLSVQKTGVGQGVQGAYAEFVRVGARETVRIPRGVDWEFGALVEPLAVALHGLNMSRFAPGDDVLIVGAGPVGIALIQWLRLSGARNIVVTELSKQRAQMAERFGASLLLDGSLHPKEIARRVLAETGGAPACIFECVGAPGVIDSCFAMAPPHSEIVSLGVCDRKDHFRPFLGTMKEITLKFAVAYLRSDFEHTLHMLETGALNPAPMITQRVKFDQLSAAFESLKTSKQDCKVLLCPGC